MNGGGVLTEYIPIGPRHPVSGAPGEFVSVLVQLRQLVEGIDARRRDKVFRSRFVRRFPRRTSGCCQGISKA